MSLHEYLFSLRSTLTSDFSASGVGRIQQSRTLGLEKRAAPLNIVTYFHVVRADESEFASPLCRSWS